MTPGGVRLRRVPKNNGNNGARSKFPLRGDSVHCSRCGAAHRGKNSVCDECARVLGNMRSKDIFASDAGSFTAAETPSATASPQPAANPPAAAASRGSWAEAFQRYSIVPLRLRGKPVKAAWLLTGGAAGLAITALGVYAWGMSAWWFILIFLSFISLDTGGDLKRRRYSRFFMMCNLEANRAGEVFYTEIGGQCPVCDGELKIREIGPKRHKETTAVCSVNGKHRWRFDPRVLGDL